MLVPWPRLGVRCDRIFRARTEHGSLGSSFSCTWNDDARSSHGRKLQFYAWAIQCLGCRANLVCEVYTEILGHVEFGALAIQVWCFLASQHALSAFAALLYDCRQSICREHSLVACDVAGEVACGYRTIASAVVHRTYATKMGRLKRCKRDTHPSECLLWHFVTLILVHGESNGQS